MNMLIKKLKYLLLGVIMFMACIIIRVDASTSQQRASAANDIAKAITDSKTSLDITKYNLSCGEMNDIILKATEKATLTFDAYGGVSSVKMGHSYNPSTLQAKSVKISYNMSKNNMLKRRKAMQAVIKDVASKTNSSMSDADIALFVHDYLVANTTYDNSPVGESFTSYKVLVKGSGVCDGYSKAYKLILEELGVPVIRVSSESMNHVWNMVQIDGAWYHVDATFDDPVWSNSPYSVTKHVSHEYFLLNDKEVKGGTNPHYSWKGGYASTSTKYTGWKMRDLKTSSYYNNGYWIYNYNGNTVQSKINGKSMKTLIKGTTNVGVCGGTLYYTRGLELYSSSLNGKNAKRVKDWSSIVTSSSSKIDVMTIDPKGKIFVGILDFPAVGGRGFYRNQTVKVSPDIQYTKVKFTYVKSKSYNRIALKWKKQSDASGYIIYRSTKKTGNYKQITKITKNSTISYTDKVAFNKKYYYKIRAYNKSNGTVYSKYSSAKFCKASLPKTSKLTAKHTFRGKVSLKWKKVKGASGYYIYRSTKKSSKYKKVSTIKKGSILKSKNKISGYNRNKTYYYKVRAYRTVKGKKILGSWSTAKKV